MLPKPNQKSTKGHVLVGTWNRVSLTCTYTDNETFQRKSR